MNTCKGCKWWKLEMSSKTYTSFDTGMEIHRAAIGSCHFNAPQCSTQDNASSFPAVAENDFCSKWEPKP